MVEALDLIDHENSSVIWFDPKVVFENCQKTRDLAHILSVFAHEPLYTFALLLPCGGLMIQPQSESADGWRKTQNL